MVESEQSGWVFNDELNHLSGHSLLFDEILRQCIAKGLVGGAILYTDSTHIKAKANKHRKALVTVETSPKEYMEELDEQIALDKFFLHQIKRTSGTFTKGIVVHDTFAAAKQGYHAYMGAYAYGHEENTDYVSCMITDMSGTVLKPFCEVWTPEPAPAEEPVEEPAAE